MRTSVRPTPLAAILTALGLLTTAAPVRSQTFTETEGNDTKPFANVFTNAASGATITGNTTGTSTTTAGTTSADYFQVSTAAAPLGVYRHTWTITTTGTAGHAGTIRGLTQTAGIINAGTDVAVQTSSTATTVPRSNTYYGFGKQEQVYYRVTGGATTTADYTATLTTVAVTPTVVSGTGTGGTFAPGNITISTIGTSTADTDFWVYDSGFNAIPGYGNDDESIAGGGTGDTLQSILTRTYTPGTFYLAISNFNTANNQASPSDEDTPSGSVLDFANAIANSSTTTNVNLNFRITDATGTPVDVTALKVNAYDVNFYQFTVAPEPTSVMAVGAGALALAGLVRRRVRAARGIAAPKPA